jgi:hypothetical protein
VTTLTLHATGPLGPDEVWERYAVPARWPDWAPQITGVELPVAPVRLHLLHWVAEGPDGGSTTGLRVSGPAPLVVGYAPLAKLAISRLVRPLR